MPHGRSRGAWICLFIGPLALTGGLIGCGGDAAPTNPSSPSNAKSAPAQEPFSKLTGDTAVGAVKEGGTLEVPFILWGGDVATFHANGGLATKPDFDYDALRLVGGLTGQSSPPRGFGDDVKFLPENTIYSFTISFEPNQSDFPESRYGEEFQRALEQASLFGKAGIAVRGHADPTKMLNAFVEIGREQGAIPGDPGDGNEVRLADGKTLNLTNNRRLVELIEKEGFGRQDNAELRATVDYLTQLSKARAEAVRKAVVSYANTKGIRMDVRQIRSDGVGILEPIFPLARSDEQMAKNRRVEFRIIKVAVEANTTGFDY